MLIGRMRSDEMPNSKSLPGVAMCGGNQIDPPSHVPKTRAVMLESESDVSKGR